MSRMIKLALVMAVVLMVVGCQTDSNRGLAPTSSSTMPQTLPKLALPLGATLDSALFFIYVHQPSNQPVDLHRVTSDWTELGITWNNFGASFAPEIIGSFTADAQAWRSVNVTSLVSEWFNGTYPNFGFILDQVNEAYPRTVYRSRENVALQPYLKVFYTLNGVPGSIQELPIADAEVNQLYPDENFGTLIALYTGWNSPTSLEKQSLLKFDIEIVSRPASLGDFVWLDENNNGIQDGGELGVAGVTVNLLDCEGNILGTTLTNSRGYYLFNNLMPGDYNVQFILPPGYVFSPQDQGLNDALDSDADPTTGLTICTSLEAGENDMTWDAGLYMPQELGCSYTIGYWKNHAGFKRQADMVTPLLPIWLGTATGTKSLNVTTATIAVRVLSQNYYGTPSNGITKLYAQLLGTKLSIANGASDLAVAPLIAAADAFLATHNYLDWTSLTETEQYDVLYWHDQFDLFNNGQLGVPHCE